MVNRQYYPVVHLLIGAVILLITAAVHHALILGVKVNNDVYFIISRVFSQFTARVENFIR